MNRKTPILILALIIGLILMVTFANHDERGAISITGYASVAEMSLDDLIAQSDLIVIGEFKAIHPSRWNTSDGKLPRDATIESVSREHLTILTDAVFQIKELLKGNSNASTIRIRTFGGQVGQDVVMISGEPAYKLGQIYLLFLSHDAGATADIDPGDFLATGVFQGVYEIRDGKAISVDDEWILEELIAYVINALGTQPVQ